MITIKKNSTFRIIRQCDEGKIGQLIYFKHMGGVYPHFGKSRQSLPCDDNPGSTDCFPMYYKSRHDDEPDEIEPVEEWCTSENGKLYPIKENFLPWPEIRITGIDGGASRFDEIKFSKSPPPSLMRQAGAAGGLTLDMLGKQFDSIFDEQPNAKGGENKMTIKVGEKYKVKRGEESECGTFHNYFVDGNAAYIVATRIHENGRLSTYGIYDEDDDKVDDCANCLQGHLIPMSQDSMTNLQSLTKEQEAGLSADDQALLALGLINNDLTVNGQGTAYLIDFLWKANKQALAEQAATEVAEIKAKEKAAKTA